MKYLSATQFKKQKSTRNALSKQFVSDVTTEGLPDRCVGFTLSTDDIDRDNDVIKQDGWQLNNYLRNPVVLWQHDSQALPIGKCVSIGITDGKLKGVVEFIPESVPEAGPRAECVYQLCKTGFLNAVSVGFRVLDWEFADDIDNRPDGADFLSCELMEFSVVTIPANPQALIDAEAPTPEPTPEAEAEVVDTETPKSTEPDDNKVASAKRKAKNERILRVLALNNRD